MSTKTNAAVVKKHNARIAEQRAELVAKIMAIRPAYDRAAVEAHGTKHGNMRLLGIEQALRLADQLDADFTNPKQYPCGHCGRVLVTTGHRCSDCGSLAECDPN